MIHHSTGLFISSASEFFRQAVVALFMTTPNPVYINRIYHFPKEE